MEVCVEAKNLKKVYHGRTVVNNLSFQVQKGEVFEKVGVQLQSSNYQNNIRVDEVCEQMSVQYKDPADYRELLKKFQL